MTTFLSFGRWLKRERQARGFTQQLLANEMGYAVSTIRKLEQGERRPTQPLVTALAAALTLTPDELLGLLHLAELAPPAVPLAIPAAFRPPSLLTPLIGRDHLLANLLHQLAPPTGRWLTLTGPPGVGKTHLATALAHRIERDHHLPVLWLSLATLTTIDDVLFALATALALPTRHQLLPVLMETLYARDLYLVLDNCEHLVPQAHVLMDLLIHAPRLHFLITSRRAFAAVGEQSVVIPPLATLPTQPATLSDAALLLVQCLRIPLPPPPERIAEYNDIATTSEGLPLALELLAAQRAVGTQPCMHARGTPSLRQPLPLSLTRSGPTVAAILDRSMSLLPDATQVLWWHCAIFRGPFAAQALQGVVDSANQHDVAEALVRLVEHSLIKAVDPIDDVPWYTQLELVRWYALAHLENQGLRASSEQRHARYLLTVITACDQALQAGESQPALAIMAANQADREAATEWAFQSQDWPMALALLNGQWRYWDQQGLWRTAKRWLTRFVAAAPNQADQRVALDLLLKCCVRQGDLAEAERLGLTLIQQLTDPTDGARVAKLWNNLGVIANRLGNLEEATRRYERARARYQSMDDHAHLCDVMENQAVQLLERGLVTQAHQALLTLQDARAMDGSAEERARILFYLGNIALLEGHPQAAQQHFTECLAQMEAQSLPYWVALNQEGLARVALWQDDLLAALAWVEGSLATVTQLGEPVWMMQCQLLLGDIALRQGKPAEASRWAAQALQRTEELHLVLGTLAAVILHGRIAQTQHLVTEALQWFTDGTTLARQVGDNMGLIHGLEGQAWGALQLTELEHASRLWREAATLRGMTGLVPTPHEQRLHDVMQQALQEHHARPG